MIELKTMRIAIADDVESMCKSIRGMLKVLGYGQTYHFAYNGQDALKIIRENEIDLLILDLNMPLMSGVEALEIIREDRTLREMPVIMVSADANREMVAEAGESEIDAYILKPLTIKSLGDKIKRVVAMVNNPTPMVTHLKRARAFKEDGHLDGALAEAKLALKADIHSSRPPREIGSLYYDMGNLAKAEKWLLKASKMNKLDVFACHMLGEIYLKGDQIEKATTYFQKAMAVSPRHVTRGINFGKALVQKGLFKKAAKVFDRAIVLSNSDTTLMETVATFCNENTFYTYAVSLLENILQAQSDRNDIRIQLGTVFDTMGKPRKAVKCFLKAEEMDSANLEIKFHLATSYLTARHLLRADQVLRNILRIDSDNDRARKLLKKCV